MINLMDDIGQIIAGWLQCKATNCKANAKRLSRINKSRMPDIIEIRNQGVLT